jgi:hypothetical protein
MDALLEVRATRFARGAPESLAASNDDEELASGTEHSDAVSSSETGLGVAAAGMGRLRAVSVAFFNGG